MDVKRGGIYVLSKEWQPFEQPIVNHLPIIVIGYNKEEEYAYAVQIGMKSEKSKLKNLIFIEFYIDRKKRISCISCDAVYKIPVEYIVHFLGYIDYEIVSEIRTKSNYFHDDSQNEKSWDEESWDNKTKNGLMNPKHTFISNVQIVGNGNSPGSNKCSGNDADYLKKAGKELTECDFDYIKKFEPDYSINVSDIPEKMIKKHIIFSNIRKVCGNILVDILILLTLFILYFFFLVVFDIDIYTVNGNFEIKDFVESLFDLSPVIGIFLLFLAFKFISCDEECLGKILLIIYYLLSIVFAVSCKFGYGSLVPVIIALSICTLMWIFSTRLAGLDSETISEICFLVFSIINVIVDLYIIYIRLRINNVLKIEFIDNPKIIDILNNSWFKGISIAVISGVIAGLILDKIKKTEE